MPKVPPTKHNTAATDSNAKRPLANPPTLWHQLHCDPILDVAIKSQDDVYSGPVAMLSNAKPNSSSGLFDGMFDAHPPPYMTAANAIALDYSAQAIGLFLNSYATTNRPEYYYIDLSLLHELRKLLNYISCDRLLRQVSLEFERKCSRHPMEWLLLASSDDDLEAAGKALVRCGTLRKGPALTIENVFGTISQLRLEWRYPLLRSMMRHRPTASGTEFEITWPDEESVKQFKEEVGVNTS